VKGNIANIPVFAALTLVVGISVLTAGTIMSEVQDVTDDTQMDQDSLDAAAGAIGVFDIGLVIINASFYIAGIILGSKARVSSAFALPAILMLGLAVWLSSELANVYYMFGQTSAIAPVAEEFTLIQQFFANFPLITLGLGGLMVIALFSKIGSGNQSVAV